MAPPSYVDLGKSSKDLFNKGYNFGFLKLDSTTKAGDKKEIEFKTGASHNVASSKLFGSLDVKYKLPVYGITLTEKWNTDNQLGTVVEIEDQIAKGFKVTLDSTYAPHLGKRSGKLKGEWFNDCVRVNTDVALDAGPVINLSAVTAYEGWLLGFQGGFDTSKSKLSATNVAVGRTTGDYAVHTFVNDGTEFGGSLFHRVNNKVEIGAQLGWTSGDHNTRFGLATKYTPMKDWTVRGKLNNSSQLAVASTHQLNPHLKLTMSAQFNIQNFQEGGHKFGIGLEFEPCC